MKQNLAPRGEFVFEDREGNVWFASSRGLDRFRELPIATISTKQGLSSSYLTSLVARADGSVWVGTHDGLTSWKNGHSTIFRKANGLPDDFVNSLFVPTHTVPSRSSSSDAGAGLKRVVAGKLERYPVHSAMNRNALMADREVDSNKLLRDRDGGLWIGTHQRGLIHIHHGRTDVFTKSDGLSGDISCSPGD